MRQMRTKSLALAAGLAAMLTVAGCHKKKPIAPPPTAPPTTTAPAPTATLTAQPDTINSGDQSVLTWQTTNATDVSIDGIGTVATSGTQSVKPTQTTTYHLVAHGDGGTTDATATVTVAAAQQTPPPQENNLTENVFEQNVKPIFYDYDSYSVRDDAKATLQADANYLNQHPEVKVVIGGYCDDRGSINYNLALGENRANAAKQALQNLGVSPDRMRTVSYGKEKQFCTQENEECWQQNRRAQFTLDQ